MTIATGSRLPDATVWIAGESGMERVSLAGLLEGKKAVLFGLPGAFTGTCTTAHVPSFVRTKDALEAKGVDAIYCIAGNDPFTMAAFGDATGATEAGLVMLSDAAAEFAKASGRSFTYEPDGMYDRIARFALVAEDGVVTVMHEEAGPGICDMTAGESILDALK